MLVQESFVRSIVILVTALQVPVDKETNHIYYNLIKDDFDDKEFESICVRIAKEENTYNKYPAIHLFYKNKPTKGVIEDAEIKTAFSLFFDKLGTELEKSFTAYCGTELIGLQAKTLRSFGGFKDLWYSVHKEDGYARSIASIKREMEKFFYDNWNAENILSLADGKMKELIEETAKQRSVTDGRKN